MKLLYIAYDSRYTLEPNEANVLFTETSKKEALKKIKDFGDFNVLVEYEEHPTKITEKNRWVIE